MGGITPQSEHHSTETWGGGKLTREATIAEPVPGSAAHQLIRENTSRSATETQGVGCQPESSETRGVDGREIPRSDDRREGAARMTDLHHTATSETRGVETESTSRSDDRSSPLVKYTEEERTPIVNRVLQIRRRRDSSKVVSLNHGPQVSAVLSFHVPEWIETSETRGVVPRAVERIFRASCPIPDWS